VLPRTRLFENPGFRRPAPETPSMAVGTLERQRVALECGDVAYLRHGSGPPLLLVHGIPTSARLWEPLLGDLGERFDCIAVDLLDMGGSRAHPGVDVASPGQAAMFEQLLDALGIDETLLALHDQGGAHGLRYLDRYGDRVKAVAIANIVCYDNWLVPAIWTLRQACAQPAVLHRMAKLGAVDAAFLKVWPFPQTAIRGPLPKAMTDDWFAPMHAGGADLDAFCNYVRAQSPEHTADTERIARAWTKPALVAWAGHDYFLMPSWGARLARDLAGAPDQPVILPFAGHYLHADVPQTAARVLGDFFAEHA
jgi:pimeloyl-ACP methyl ester carboxylesterase